MRDHRVRRPASTVLVLAVAEATWWTADRIRDGAELLERAAGATGNAGHDLITMWGDWCEFRATLDSGGWSPPVTADRQGGGE